jgi:hypothetical protein
LRILKLAMSSEDTDNSDLKHNPDLDLALDYSADFIAEHESHPDPEDDSNQPQPDGADAHFLYEDLSARVRSQNASESEHGPEPLQSPNSLDRALFEGAPLIDINVTSANFDNEPPDNEPVDQSPERKSSLETPNESHIEEKPSDDSKPADEAADEEAPTYGYGVGFVGELSTLASRQSRPQNKAFDNSNRSYVPHGMPRIGFPTRPPMVVTAIPPPTLPIMPILTTGALPIGAGQSMPPPHPPTSMAAVPLAVMSFPPMRPPPMQSSPPGANEGPYWSCIERAFLHARYFIIKSSNAENVLIAKTQNVWSTLPTNESRLERAFQVSQTCHSGY